MTISIPINRLDPDMPIPTRAHNTDAGIDLYASESIFLASGCRALVPTGVAIAIPDGYAGFIHPRSGLALDHGLTVLNTPGTIDSGYRGEIRVCLINHDPDETMWIQRGDRIAQLVVQKVELVTFTEIDDHEEFHATDRGAHGFGSSGRN